MYIRQSSSYTVYSGIKEYSYVLYERFNNRTRIITPRVLQIPDKVIFFTCS